MSWQHFAEVRSLIQSSEPDRWQRIAVLMIGHGGEDDPAARAYVASAIERLPMHERPCRIVVSYGGGGSIAKLKADDAVVPGADVLGCVECAWKEDAQRTVGLLFNEGQFLRQLHTYAKPKQQGYPMPSAEVGGPTTWIKTQGDTK